MRFIELLNNKSNILRMSRSPNTRSTNIYNNSNHPIQTNPKFIKDQVHFHSNQQSFTENQIDSQAEPAFETQNYVYELKSRCNNLEYEKTKHQMAYQNIVSELRQKNAYLEHIASNLSQRNQQLAEQRDEVRNILSEVREENHQLAKQIERFKLQIRELQSIRKISHEYEHEQNLMFELEQKNEEIGQQESRIIELQNQLNRYESTEAHSQYPKESVNLLRQQIGSLSKQLETVKKELDQAQRNQEQIKKLQQLRQQAIKGLKLKEAEIASLQQEKLRLQQENERSKDNFMLKEKRYQSSHQEEVRRLNQAIKTKEEQLQESQNSKNSTQMKVTELTVQLSRVKSQNSGLDQYNKYLQSCNVENENKRKMFQQEIYKYEKEVSQLRTLLFNEKLQNKKYLSSIRLSFEEQKIKHIEQIDEKSKQILKLKELSASSQRQSLDYDRVNNRYENLTAEIEKASHQMTHLKAQNQKLKQDKKHLETKYQKKNEKYANIEKDLKSEYGNRIKSLQNQIYKLQLQNSQMQLKIEAQQKPLKKNHKDSLEDIIQLLKLQNKQKQGKIKQLQDKCKKQQDKLSRLEVEIRQPRQYYNREEANSRLKAIDELQSENTRLNDQLRRQRAFNDQNKRQSAAKQQKISYQLRKIQEQNEVINKKLRQSQQQFTIVEKKKLQLQEQIREKQRQRRKIQDQFSLLKSHSEASAIAIKETHLRQVEDLKRAKQRQVNQIKYKQQIQAQKIVQNKQQQPSSEELELIKKCDDLQKENYQLKVDYSQSLQQINSLLISYRKLQEKHKKLIAKNEEAKLQINSIKSSKVSSDYLLKQIQQYKQLNSNYQAQIQRLNQALLEKQKELKQLNSTSNPFFHPKVEPRVKETQLWLSPRHINQLRNGNKSYKN